MFQKIEAEKRRKLSKTLNELTTLYKQIFQHYCGLKKFLKPKLLNVDQFKIITLEHFQIKKLFKAA